MPPPQDFTLEIPIFAKLYDFYKNLSQVLTYFPKVKRFTLGERLDIISLELIELIIFARYLPRDKKLATLSKVSVKLDLLKILIRLSFETKCLDNNKYQQLTSQIIEIGKMLGGWIRIVK